MLLINQGTLTNTIELTMQNAYLWLLIVIVGLDYIVGTARAIINKELNSHTGLRGLIKHSVIIIMAVIMCSITIIGEVEYLGLAFLGFYIFDYVVSIVENLEDIGVPFPEPIQQVLKQWHDRNMNKWR